MRDSVTHALVVVDKRTDFLKRFGDVEPNVSNRVCGHTQHRWH